MTVILPPRQNEVIIPPYTLRFMNIRGGRLADLLLYLCTRMNPIIVTTKTANKTMILAELQGYFTPPHPTASNRQRILGRKRNVPSRSKNGSFSLNFVWEVVVWGVFQLETSSKMHDDSAKGKLIKKHHRHDAYCVRTPPSLVMSVSTHLLMKK